MVDNLVTIQSRPTIKKDIVDTQSGAIPEFGAKDYESAAIQSIKVVFYP